MTTTFNFHNDPGHGWIEVNLHEMRRSGLNPTDFSVYSYRRGNTFYLEEDCDAAKFIAAWQERTGEHAKFKDCYAETTFIRDLPPIHE